MYKWKNIKIDKEGHRKRAKERESDKKILVVEDKIYRYNEKKSDREIAS